jgi:hypothetical protein
MCSLAPLDVLCLQETMAVRDVLATLHHDLHNNGDRVNLANYIKE